MDKTFVCDKIVQLLNSNSKVNRGAAATGISTPKRRRKRPSRGGGPSSGASPPPQPIIPAGSQLQERLARVEEQFAAQKRAAGNEGSDGDEENDEVHLRAFFANKLSCV